MMPMDKNGSVSSPVRYGIMVLLAVVFLLAHHDLFRSTYPDFVPVSGASSAARVDAIQQGRPLRRVAFLSMGALGVVCLGIRRHGSRLNYAGVLLLAYLGWMAVSLGWSDNPMLTIRRLIVMACFAVGAIGVSRVLSVRDLRNWAILCGAGFLCLGLIAEIVLGTFNPLSSGHRFAGTLHPNGQGLNCAVLVLALVSTARERAVRFKGIFWALTLLAFLALLMTRSRTALGACMVVLFFLLWPQVDHAKRKSLAVALYLTTAATLVALIALAEVWAPFLEDVVRLGRPDSVTRSLTGRIPLWGELWPYVRDRPLTGYGYGGFWYPSRVLDIDLWIGWATPNAHSIYVELLLGLGVIGLTLFVLLMTVVFVRTKRHEILGAEYRFSGSVILFAAVHGFAETTVLEPDVLLFLFLWVAADLGFPMCPTRRVPPG